MNIAPPKAKIPTDVDGGPSPGGVKVVRQNVRIVFPPSLVTEPIVYQLGKEFGIATNIRRANVTKDEGWVILELQGPEEDVEGAIQWAQEKGVTVELLPGELKD